MENFRNISQSRLLNIYRIVEETNVFESFANRGTFADFVADIWNVHNMQSEDERFKTKYEDIVQHYVNNRDYSYDDLFLSKLRIQDDNYLESFLNSVVKLRFHESPIQLQNFVDKLNKLLSSVGLCYRISETDGNNKFIG
jgi:hypothetical protein